MTFETLERLTGESSTITKGALILVGQVIDFFAEAAQFGRPPHR
ncbi:MAG: hypothetical protein ABI811_03875 [Acidobacteriota bacterium]